MKKMRKIRTSGTDKERKKRVEGRKKLKLESRVRGEEREGKVLLSAQKERQVMGG